MNSVCNESGTLLENKHPTICRLDCCTILLSYRPSTTCLGQEFQVVENGDVPRPEEDRITQAEKNERIREQLKVR